MKDDIRFTSESELNQFKSLLSEKVINGEFEIIASNNAESKNWNIFVSSTFRNTTSKEYFKLSSTSGIDSYGEWKKVRAIIREKPLLVRSEYLFRALAGSNFGLVGYVNLQLEQLAEDVELEIEIVFSEDITNRYLRTSLEFGLIYGFETLQPFNPLKGRYVVKVLSAGFHEIDSSTTTMAYAANMALRRAFDVEKATSMLYESGRFILHKAYPIHKAIVPLHR